MFYSCESARLSLRFGVVTKQQNNKKLTSLQAATPLAAILREKNILQGKHFGIEHC